MVQVFLVRTFYQYFKKFFEWKVNEPLVLQGGACGFPDRAITRAFVK